MRTGRPKSKNPRIFFGVRLPKDTVETIKAMRDDWKARSDADVIVAMADYFRPKPGIAGSTIVTALSLAKAGIPVAKRWVAPRAEEAEEISRIERKPILKPNGKI